MDRHGLLVVLLFLFMIGLGRCDALNSRKLVTTTDPNGSSNANQVRDLLKFLLFLLIKFDYLLNCSGITLKTTI